MAVEISGGVWKNSPQVQFSDGFHHEGKMSLREIVVSARSEDEVQITLIGSEGLNDKLHELYFWLPLDTANSLAKIISSFKELKVQKVRLEF